MGAAIINKFMDMIGINNQEESEEYNEVEQYETENDVEDSYEVSNSKSRRSFSEIEKENPYSSKNIQTKVIPMNTGVSSSKMVITQPTCFEDVREIGDYLKGKKSVIVNLENTDKEDARRILDFLSGSVFMIEGTLQKVSNLIYLMTPKNVEIQNDIERNQYKQQQQKSSFSWLK